MTEIIMCYITMYYHCVFTNIFGGGKKLRIEFSKKKLLLLLFYKIYSCVLKFIQNYFFLNLQLRTAHFMKFRRV